MTKQCKRYLLSFLYEEIEKNYHNAKHQNNIENIKRYKNWLNQIKNRNIQSTDLKYVLKNMKDAYKNRMIDMPYFIELLLQGKLRDDSELNFDIENFQIA